MKFIPFFIFEFSLGMILWAITSLDLEWSPNMSNLSSQTWIAANFWSIKLLLDDIGNVDDFATSDAVSPNSEISDRSGIGIFNLHSTLCKNSKSTNEKDFDEQIIISCLWTVDSKLYLICLNQKSRKVKTAFLWKKKFFIAFGHRIVIDYNSKRRP